MANPHQPGLFDKLMIIPNISQTLLSVITRAITGPLIGGARANTYFKDVVFAALRTNLSITSAETEQWLIPTTESGYLKLAKGKSFQPDTTVLEGGLKLHWIGPKTAKKVFLYFHGGGYVLSCSAGHHNWLYELQQALSKEGASVSVVLVGYTLAPHGQYPKQLQEAADSLQWLLETQKYRPSDIIIGGDSAGGNMATMLLLHLLHPHSGVTGNLKLSEPLAGAVLISPWWKFKAEDDSVKRNATSDMLTPAAATRWSSLFLGSASIDNYNQPYLADAGWFKGLDKVVKDVLVWGGGAEILIDSIEFVSKKLKEAHPRIELVVEPGSAHEDFILDKLLGYKVSIGKGGEVVESWVAQRVR